MESVYLLRHQAGGYLTDFVFAEEPGEDDIAAAMKICDARHGTHHPKTEERYWIRGVRVKLTAKGELPALIAKAEEEAKARGVSVSNPVGHVKAGAPNYGVEAVGRVELP